MISSRVRDIVKNIKYELKQDEKTKRNYTAKIMSKEDEEFLKKYNFYRSFNEYKNLFEESDEYDEDDDMKYFIPVKYDIDYLLNNTTNFFFSSWNDQNTKNNILNTYIKMDENMKNDFLKKIQKNTVQFYGYNFNESLVLFCDVEDKTFYGKIYNNSVRTYPVIELLIKSLYSLFSTNQFQGCACENCVQDTMDSLSIKYQIEFTLRRFIDEIKYILWECP